MSHLFRHPGWIAVWVACGVLAFGVVTSQWLIERDRLALENHLEHEVEASQARLNDAFQRYIGLMFSVRGWLYNHSEESWRDAQDFIATLELSEQYPALNGLGFVRRIAIDDVPAWLERTRRRGLSENVQVRPVRPRTTATADLYLVDWITPAGQDRFIGLELSSDPIRWEAMQRAAVTGNPAVTAPIRLSNSNRAEYGLLLVLPVYRGGVTPASEEARLLALQGFITLGLPAMPMAKEAGLLAGDRYDWHWLDPKASPAAAATPPGHAIAKDASTATLGVELLDSDSHQIGATTPETGAWQGMAEAAAHAPVTLGQRQYELFVRSTPTLEKEWEPLAAMLVGVGSMPMALLAGWATMAAFRLRRGEKDRIHLLQQDVERLSLVARHTHNAIVMCDRTGSALWTNKACEEVTGYKAEDLLGQVPWEMLRCERTDPQVLSLLREAVQLGQACKVDVLNRAKEGREYWVAVELIPLKDALQRCNGFIAVQVDITERMETKERLEAALAESEGLMNAVRQHAIVSQTAPDGMIIDVNPAFCAVSGHTREALIGETHRLIHSELHDDAFWSRFWQTITQGQAWRGQVANRTKHGDVYWVDSIVTPVMDPEGQIERYISIQFDITDRKNAETALQASKQRLDNILRATDAGTWVMDVAHGEVEVDDRWLRMLGRSEQAGISLGLDTFMNQVHPDERSSVTQALQAHIQGDSELFEYTHRIQHAQGHWIWVRTRGQAFDRDNQGHAQVIYGISLDISGLKASEEEAESARLMAEDANRAKSQFLANMSHEIRTPMNAVLGMLQLMLGTPMEPRQLDYAEKAEAAAKSLLGIINDILDFSKIEAGKLELDLNPFDLDELWGGLATIYAANLRGKRLELLFDIDPDIPRVLVGDALRLQQILINLGGNAIKFTPAGSVTLRVRLAMRFQDENGTQRVRLQFAMIDTGIGIPFEAQERLFSAFTQAESSTTRRFGGTGLGLVISQRLTGLMGGELAVQSAPGEGSTFTFEIELPVAREWPSTLKAGATTPQLQGKRCLVVEPHPLAREILCRSVQQLGGIAQPCSDAQAALSGAASSATPFDMALVNWHLPDMDGLALIDRLRTASQSASHPIQCLVTATDRDLLSQLTPAQQAALDGLLIKPVTPQLLLNALRVADGSSRHTTGGSPAPSIQRRLLGMRVLVVEDNPINQQVASKLLQREGAVVGLADHGQAALDLLRPGSPPWDLVLMDMQMPVMDGIQATQAIRKQLGLHDLPIIAMTANVMAQDRQTCMAAGMNDHVGKPFSIDELVKVLHHWAPHAARTDTASSAPAACQPNRAT